MKSLCKMLSSLCILYIVLNCILSYFSIGHEIRYDILRKKDKITVTEKFIQNKKEEENSYTIKIRMADETFEYHVMHKFMHNKKIIEDAFFVNDKSYQCFLPIFQNQQILTDIICKNSKNQYYNYTTLDSPSTKLKEFADDMKLYGYNSTNYKDQKNVKRKIDLLELYPQNIPSNLLFGLTNYKGLYMLKDLQLSNILLFDQDIYTREISAFVEGKYVVADYDDVYDIKKFFVIDLKTGDKEEIISKEEIASDSYIAGIVGDSMYIVDKSNKKEYQLSVSNLSILEIGNETNDMKYYKKGKWEIVPYSRMTLKNTYFDLFEETDDGEYYLFMNTGGKTTGYSYYYKKVNSKFEIYRSQTGEKHQKMYLFTVDDVDHMSCSKHYIFYRSNNEIKYYSDYTGVRTLLSNSELEFNSDILYGIYEK